MKKAILALGIIALFIGMTLIPATTALKTPQAETMEQATTDYDGGYSFLVAYVSGNVNVSQFFYPRTYEFWANEEITISGIGIKLDGTTIFDVIPLPRVAHLSAGTRFIADVPFARLNRPKEGAQDLSCILFRLVTR